MRERDRKHSLGHLVRNPKMELSIWGKKKCFHSEMSKYENPPMTAEKDLIQIKIWMIFAQRLPRRRITKQMHLMSFSWKCWQAEINLENIQLCRGEECLQKRSIHSSNKQGMNESELHRTIDLMNHITITNCVSYY